VNSQPARESAHAVPSFSRQHDDNVESDVRDDGEDVRHDERHAGGQHEEDVRRHERNVASDAGNVLGHGYWKGHDKRDEEDAGSNDGDPERNVWDGNAQIASDTADSLTQFEKSTPNAETKNTSYIGNRGRWVSA